MLLATLWWLDRTGDGSPSQAELAERAGTDPMMTSQVLRKLEQRALLERYPDPADSRARLVAITPAGRSLLTGALADVEATDALYFAALGPRPDAFLDALKTLGSRD